MAAVAAAAADAGVDVAGDVVGEGEAEGAVAEDADGVAPSQTLKKAGEALWAKFMIQRKIRQKSRRRAANGPRTAVSPPQARFR